VLTLLSFLIESYIVIGTIINTVRLDLVHVQQLSTGYFILLTTFVSVDLNGLCGHFT
jgi:hypothetical protein